MDKYVKIGLKIGLGILLVLFLPVLVVLLLDSILLVMYFTGGN